VSHCGVSGHPWKAPASKFDAEKTRRNESVGWNSRTSTDMMKVEQQKPLKLLRPPDSLASIRDSRRRRL
jgi:hypothetical protein